MVPPSPTAVPLFASMKETAHRVCVVPLAWIVQLFPPSVVLTIVPYSPTTVPVSASTKEAPRRLFPCGRGFCQCQLDEPPVTLLATVATDLLPAWMASASPQALVRLRIVNGILVCVIFIIGYCHRYGFISWIVSPGCYVPRAARLHRRLSTENSGDSLPSGCPHL